MLLVQGSHVPGVQSVVEGEPALGSPRLIRVPTVRPAGSREAGAQSEVSVSAIDARLPALLPETRPLSPSIRSIKPGNTMSIAVQLEEQLLDEDDFAGQASEKEPENEEAQDEMVQSPISFLPEESIQPSKRGTEKRTAAPTPRRHSVAVSTPVAKKEPALSAGRKYTMPLPRDASERSEVDHDADERDDVISPIEHQLQHQHQARPPSRNSIGTPGLLGFYSRPSSRGPSPSSRSASALGSATLHSSSNGGGARPLPVPPPLRSSTASPGFSALSESRSPPTRPSSSASLGWRSIFRTASPSPGPGAGTLLLADSASSVFSVSPSLTPSARDREREAVGVAELADRACLRGWEASAKHRKAWRDEVERVARERCRENKSRSEQRKEAQAQAQQAQALAMIARATTPECSTGRRSSAQKLAASYQLRSQAAEAASITAISPTAEPTPA